jgi:hypothetical protein
MKWPRRRPRRSSTRGRPHAATFAHGSCRTSVSGRNRSAAPGMPIGSGGQINRPADGTASPLLGSSYFDTPQICLKQDTGAQNSFLYAGLDDRAWTSLQKDKIKCLLFSTPLTAKPNAEALRTVDFFPDTARQKER